jgi:hypothetical protein
MGNTVWILSDSQDSDEWDHTFLLKNEKPLNKLCKELGLKKLSDFFDLSVLAEEFDGEAEPNYSDPAELEIVLQALLAAIQKGKSTQIKNETEVLEELQDCLQKVLSAKANKEKVRVAIIP